MQADPRLELVLLWHMHQPDYRDFGTRELRQPWVYLHAIKDYADMAWHLEHHPGMKAVVNFTPVLLDQLEDYAEQLASGELRDPWLRLMFRDPAKALTPAERTWILQGCLRAEHHRVFESFAAYKGLHDLAVALEKRGPDGLHYLADQYFFDLLTWYQLCWTGETVRRSSETVTRLITKGGLFTLEERRELLKLIAELVSGIIPRFAKLAASGQIELSTTPQHHPLAPLLISLASAREADPGTLLPEAAIYPGGYQRVAQQLESALREHQRRFGSMPAGVWPAEGAVSSVFLDMLARHGCRWAASGSAVLMNSLRRSTGQPPNPAQALYRPYRWAGAADMTIFFRDDRLSDLIGFEYARWNGHDAAANFIAELEAIAAQAPAGEVPLVSVILDGENCWEYYAYNGYYFLSQLYRLLESHPRIRTATFGESLQRPDRTPLQSLSAGSWVHGNFSTWIGSPEKNRAWDLLCAAKQSFDLVMASGRLDEAAAAAASRQLAACEASDWFWWLGEYNPAPAVAEFDELYRSDLARLYRTLNLPEPAALAQPLSRGTGHPEAGGAMRRAVAEAQAA